MFDKLFTVTYFKCMFIFFSSYRYNCEDPNCYFDLARLRGLKYVTWENKEKIVQQDEVNTYLEYFRTII